MGASRYLLPVDCEKCDVLEATGPGGHCQRHDPLVRYVGAKVQVIHRVRLGVRSLEDLEQMPSA